MGGLPPVFIEFLGKTTGIKAAVRGVESEIAAVDAQGAGAFQKTGMMGKAAILGLGVAAADVAVKTVHMAADFQTQMTRVQTGAGELKANLKSVGQGVLAMAGQVGQSTSQLTAGLYMTESAGYHGSAALEVLKNSAEGAKVGAADLHTVTDAVTTALNAYKMGADQSAQATNALIATEAEGKTNLEALAGSMASVLPTAAAAKVGLNEVLGAMATMTAQGTPAAVSATYLRQTIGALSNPSGKAAREMADLGLSAVKVGQNLGKNGLASTLEMLTTAITSRMGPAGTVLIQHLAKAAHNTTAYQKELANLSPAQQTYIGALATMVGGTKSMMAALELTGPHMADFKKNTEGVNERVKAGGKNIEGWSEVQKTFNQQAAQAKASLGAMGIQIGQYLMPYVQQLVSALAKGTTWLTQHAMAAKVAAGVIGGILVFALVAATAAMIDLAVAAAANPMTWIVLGAVAVVAAIVMLAMHWRQVWDGIKAVTAVVVSALVTAWQWLRDNTMDIWDDITGSVTSAWQATAAWFSSAWHTVVDPIVGAWNWLVSTTTAVWNGIAGFFRKWWPLLLVIFAFPIAVLIATWNHFHTQIIAVVRATWGMISAFLGLIWSGLLVVARVAWAAIQLAIITPVMAVWHAVQSVWKTISGWLSSAWKGIEKAASLIWGRIKSSMTGPITSAWHTISTTVSSIAKSIQSGLDGAWKSVSNIGTKFLSIGKGIIEGIIQGVENAGGDLVGKLEDMAGGALNATLSFLGINSPSKVFADRVGLGIVEGIGLGVTSNAHLAHNAVTDLAAGTVDAFSSELQINSPSKKFATLGAYVIAGLVAGLTGSTAQVKTATTKISDALYVDFGSHQKVLQQAITKDDSLLRTLAARRDATAAQLKAAQSRMASLQKEWASEKSGIASGIMQSASIITASPDEGRAVNAGDVVDQMRQRVQAALQFASELDQLRKKGLNSSLIEQLANAGVDQAGATAAALAAGSKGQIDEMNRQQANLQNAANATGSSVADAMYGAGLKTAQGLVKGLQSQESAIEKQMLKIALAMQKAIKSALGIHSPSQVFADLGQFIPQGLAAGIAAGAHHATAAVAALGGSLGTGSGLSLGGAGGAGAAVVNQYLTVQVQGSVLTSGDQLVDVVQGGFLRLGSHNSQTFQSFHR